VSVVVAAEQGTITVPAATLVALVVRAAERVDGARVRRGRRHVEVSISDGRAQVALDVVARYGTILPELARNVQEEVTDALATMCGVIVDAVDVEVEEVE
jgi:uncharacterized alkaline shock family protein YloU